MKNVEKSVKLKGVEVGPASVPVLETEEDLQAYLDKVKLPKVLQIINAQVSTNICNALRAEHREGTPGKGKRRNAAINVLMNVTFPDGQTGVDKLNACCTLENEDSRSKAVEDLLMSPEVQKAVDEKLAAA